MDEKPPWWLPWHWPAAAWIVLAFFCVLGWAFILLRVDTNP